MRGIHKLRNPMVLRHQCTLVPLKQKRCKAELRKSLILSSILFMVCVMDVTISIRIVPSSKENFDMHNTHRQLDEDKIVDNSDIFDNNINDSSISNNNENNKSSFGRQRKVESVKISKNPDDHLVKSLPLLADDDFPTPHWAGLLPASAQGDKYFFYWLFAPDTFGPETDSIPLVIWLNGGPGCSSMDGLFLENGPFRFVLENPDDKNSNWKLAANEFSWHTMPAYVVYIDQPVGTGLSFTTSGKYPTKDELVNIDFYHFLREFLTLHEDKFLINGTANGRKTRRPIYFSGESHAGHYIPSMMAYILKENNKTKNNDMHIELAGAAIGNGWMDPYHQYAGAAAAYGHGIIGRSQAAALDEKEKKCQLALSQGKYRNDICFDLVDDIVRYSLGSEIGDPKKGYKVSSYDVRKIEAKNKKRTFPKGHKVLEAYLGGRSVAWEGGKMTPNIFYQVLQAVHAVPSRDAGQNFQECTDPPYRALSHQDGLGVVDDVVYLLEHSRVRLLFFNGIEDLICNHVGNEIFLENMEWKHQQDYIKSHRYAWKSPVEKRKGKINGYMKQYNNQLLFLKLLDSGHMVPLDIPHIALSMMQIFVDDIDSTKSSFEQYEQELDTVDSRNSPKCPLCENTNNKNNNDNSNCDDNGQNDSTTTGDDGSYSLFYQASKISAASGTRIIALTWVGAFVMIGVIIVFLIYNRRRVGRFSSRTQYDMELRERRNNGDGSHRHHLEALTASDMENEDSMDDDSSLDMNFSNPPNVYDYARKKQID